MGIIEIIWIIFGISILFLFPLFFILSFYIYKNRFTFHYFIIWLLSYLFPVGFYYLIYPQPPLPLYLQNNIGFLLFMTSMFFILRIEERGFTPKYVIGFLISLAVYLLMMTFIDFTIFSFLFNLNGLINRITYFYYIKIIILNYMGRKKGIKYPFILIGFPIFFILIGLLIGQAYNNLISLYYLSLIIIFFAIFPLLNYYQKWFYPKNFKEEFHRDKEMKFFPKLYNYFKTKAIIQEIPIKTTGHPLCDQIEAAINNGRNLDFKGYKLDELQFMLICINIRKEAITRDLSLSRDLLLVAFSLISIPLIKIIYSIFNYLTIHSIFNYLKGVEKTIDIFLQNFTNIVINFIKFVFQFNKDVGVLLTIIFIFIYLLLIDLFFHPPGKNNRIQIWLKSHEIIYETIWIIIFIGFLIKAFLSIEIDKIDVIIFTISSLFMIANTLKSNSINEKLARSEKLMLDLNKEIIFQKENYS